MLLVLSIRWKGILAQSVCLLNAMLHKLDFWLGDWKVYIEKEEFVGTNTIRKPLNGCMVEENLEDAFVFKGISTFYIDDKTSKW